MREPGDHVVKLRSLPSGWSARVACSPSIAKGLPVPTGGLPSVDAWTLFLRTVIQDASRLRDYHAIKRSRHAEVFRATLEWEDDSLMVVVKMRRLAGAAKKIRARLGFGPEARQFRVGQALSERCVATAKPLGYGMSRGPGSRAMLVTAYIHDAVDLDQLALVQLPQATPIEAFGIKRALARLLATFTAHMQEAGVAHRDYKASNILVSNLSDVARLQPWLVDLEGLRLHRQPIVEADRWTPIVRLAASLADYSSVTRSDFARFLKAYLTHQPNNTCHWKTRYLELANQVALYNRKSRARKTHKLDGYNG